jgi:hypothetical protein
MEIYGEKTASYTAKKEENVKKNRVINLNRTQPVGSFTVFWRSYGIILYIMWKAIVRHFSSIKKKEFDHEICFSPKLFQLEDSF